MATSKRRKSEPKKPAVEPKWKTVEKVVALLEQSLAPESRVRHNVKLPSITTGHEEQCDVVIELGNEPRVTRTIVEVQKRHQRVKPNDFRGWLVKMKDVGAHRLICVSTQPFPRSVIDKVAKELGPTVLLVRLKDLEQNQWPIQILDGAVSICKPRIEVDTSVQPFFHFEPNKNPFKQPNVQLNCEDKVIRREGQTELLPLMDLINEGVRKLQDHRSVIRLGAGTHRIDHKWKPKGVCLCVEGVVGLIQAVSIRYLVEVRPTSFPFVISSYNQEGHEKSLAWIATASGKLDGAEVEVRLTLIPNSNGAFKLGGLQVLGVDEGHFMWREVKGTGN